MRKLRIYLDTSVFGGTDDELSEASKWIFKRSNDGEFTLLISQITLDELQGAPEQV